MTHAPRANKKAAQVALRGQILPKYQSLELLGETGEPLPAKRVVGLDVRIRVGDIVLIEDRRLLVGEIP
jgi:hypothetical protein